MIIGLLVSLLLFSFVTILALIVSEIVLAMVSFVGVFIVLCILLWRLVIIDTQTDKRHRARWSRSSDFAHTIFDYKKALEEDSNDL